MLNSSIQTVTEEKGDKKILYWEIQNLIAYDEAPYSNYLCMHPHLMIGLGDVEMGGYKGNMSTWNELCPVLWQSSKRQGYSSG